MELTFANAISIKDDSGGFESRGSVKLDEKLSDHGTQFVDDFLSMFLYSDRCSVARRMGVHTTYHLLL